MAAGVVYLTFEDEHGDPIPEGAPVRITVYDDDGGVDERHVGNTMKDGIFFHVWDREDALQVLKEVQGNILACGQNHEFEVLNLRERVGLEEVVKFYKDVSGIVGRGNIPSAEDVKGFAEAATGGSAEFVLHVFEDDKTIPCPAGSSNTDGSFEHDQYIVEYSTELQEGGFLTPEIRVFRYRIIRPEERAAPIYNMIDLKICFPDRPEALDLDDAVDVDEDTIPPGWEYEFEEDCLIYQAEEDVWSIDEGTEHEFVITTQGETRNVGFARVNISYVDPFNGHEEDEETETEVLGPSLALVDHAPSPYTNVVLTGQLDKDIVTDLEALFQERDLTLHRKVVGQSLFLTVGKRSEFTESGEVASEGHAEEM